MKNLYVIISVFLLATVFGCKKEKEKEPQPTTANKVLVIDNGAQTIQQGARMSNSGSWFQNTTYSASFVDLNGNVTVATNVTWSSSADSIVSINNTSGFITISAQGSVTITATVTDGGVTYTALVPVSITLPGIFVVVPSVIIMSTSETIDLTPVFFTTEIGVSYSYTSDNTSVVGVNNTTGTVTSVSAGSAVVTVTATTSQGNPTFDVPVLVIGDPAVAIPVTSVTVSPVAKNLFKNDVQQFTAKAFSGTNDVTSNETFTWSSSEPTVASVDASSGLVKALQIGETVIKATAKGISGYAEVLVNPDTVVLINPFWTSVSAGGTKQFSAIAYNAKTVPITPYPGVTNFIWEIPSFGPGFEMFNIGTVSNTGLVTVSQNALVGLPGILIASVGGSPTAAGAAIITVGIASPCNCGADDPNVTSIAVSNPTINLSLSMGPFTEQINAITSPGTGTLVYCSDNDLVVTVDFTGMIAATGPGTATIKVCVGSLFETVTVNVTL